MPLRFNKNFSAKLQRAYTNYVTGFILSLFAYIMLVNKKIKT